jgi:hypothetical protein
MIEGPLDDGGSTVHNVFSLLDSTSTDSKWFLGFAAQRGHLTGFETFNFEEVSAELQFFVYPVRLFPSRDAIEPPVTDALASCRTWLRVEG